MLWGIIISIIGLHLRNVERRMNAKRIDSIVAGIGNDKKISVTGIHFAGIGSAFLKGAIMAIVFIPVGTVFCGMITFLPDQITSGISQIKLMIWGIVSAFGFFFYFYKSKYKYLTLDSINGYVYSSYLSKEIKF